MLSLPVSIDPIHAANESVLPVHGLAMATAILARAETPAAVGRYKDLSKPSTQLVTKPSTLLRRPF